MKVEPAGGIVVSSVPTRIRPSDRTAIFLTIDSRASDALVSIVVPLENQVHESGARRRDRRLFGADEDQAVRSDGDFPYDRQPGFGCVSLHRSPSGKSGT